MSAPYPRHYRTERGSTATVPRWGVWECEFDWLEEGACFNAACSVSIEDDDEEPMMHWHCECCDDGFARLIRCEAPASDEVTP